MVHAVDAPPAGRVVFPFIGDTVGGSHVSAMQLIKRLSEENFDAAILVHQSGPLTERLTRAGIEWRRCDIPFYHGGPGIKEALRLLPGQFGALRALRARRAQIVHINDSRTVITWAMACRLARTKLVVHQRTVYAPSRLLRLALRLALRIICISHYVYETLPLELRARAVVIPNPFAMPKAAEYRHVDREVARRELGLPPGRPVIGFVGSLTEQKRPFVFLDAATHIQAVQAPIFIMVGQAEASMVAKVESYARRQGIEDRLFMMGYRSDMERILTACDLILAPAVNEGFGRVPIEAALAGVAVVAARSGGHVEAIEDGRTGILVPPDDPVSLAAAATSLLINRSLIDTLAAAGRERAMRLYAPEVHCRKISAIYRELLL